MKDKELQAMADNIFSIFAENDQMADFSEFLSYLKKKQETHSEDVQVTIFTDTLCGPELEKLIGDFCAKNVQAKRAIVKQVVDKDYKGGLKIRWRDFVCDATYLQALKGF